MKASVMKSTLVVAFLLLLPVARPAEEVKPNIVVILADDLGYG